MLTNSREIKTRLEREGWVLVRAKGSHHIFRNSKTGMIIVLPHPKKDLGQGLIRKIYRDANWLIDSNRCMTHYVAIVEEEDGKAFGVWFPDLPGCVSAGDTLDEAMLNAAEALELWAGAMIENGQTVPAARSLTDLKAVPEVAQESGPLYGGAHPLSARCAAARGRMILTHIARCHCRRTSFPLALPTNSPECFPAGCRDCWKEFPRCARRELSFVLCRACC